MSSENNVLQEPQILQNFSKIGEERYKKNISSENAVVIEICQYVIFANKVAEKHVENVKVWNICTTFFEKKSRSMIKHCCLISEIRDSKYILYVCIYSSICKWNLKTYVFRLTAKWNFLYSYNIRYNMILVGVMQMTNQSSFL